MAVQSSKNVMTVLVANETSTSIAPASVQITDSSTAATYIADGQTVLLDSQNRPMTGATANIGDSPFIQFVNRTGATASTANLNYSARIRGLDIVRVTGKTFVAATEQITIIGSNGTTGSIDASAVDYTLTFVGDWDYGMWEEQKFRKAYPYSSTAATQQLVAQNLSALFNLDGFRATLAGVGPQAKCEVLNDGTAADWTSAGTIAVVNGSDIATLSATSANAQVVGAVLRLGSTGSGVGVTVPVYVVTAIPTTDSTLTATQVRLHTYFQGASAATLDATSGDAGIVATATNWGMKFTGLPQTTGIPPYSDFKYQKVAFHIDLKGFGTTTNTTPTGASRGNGEGEHVQEFEYFAMGNEGALNRTVIPLPTGRAAALAANNYSSIVIESYDRQGSSSITGTPPMIVQTVLFFKTTTAQIAPLISLLNMYIATVPAALPAVSII